MGWAAFIIKNVINIYNIIDDILVGGQEAGRPV